MEGPAAEGQGSLRAGQVGDAAPAAPGARQQQPQRELLLRRARHGRRVSPPAVRRLQDGQPRIQVQ